MMKHLKAAVTAVGFALLTTIAIAQEPPKFYSETYPEFALKARLEAEAVLVGDGAKLDPKTRELIALAVAAQIPCAYCVYVHDKHARANGAGDSEIREAVATAAHVRHWSTVLNGMAYDFEAFKAEVDGMSGSP
jgi:AhpD family alkylhydroperoxidase